MSEQHSENDEPAAYDVRAVQDKWLPVWESMAPFTADDASPKPKRYAL
ncbi:MAG: leucyl-tRNA synthetase, partial [Nocardioidaceae bacterium]|nr:leucyl-tRNA synthetase [Nocardioidaceae bacterium]